MCSVRQYKKRHSKLFDSADARRAIQCNCQDQHCNVEVVQRVRCLRQTRQTVSEDRLLLFAERLRLRVPEQNSQGGKGTLPGYEGSGHVQHRSEQLSDTSLHYV